MKSDYELLLENQRQVLIDTAQLNHISISMHDISALNAPNLLEDMKSDEVLSAIKEGLFKISDIIYIHAGFSEFYRTHVIDRLFTGDPIQDTMSNEFWINLHADHAMVILLRKMITQPYSEALRTEKYDCKDVHNHARTWGLKAVHTLNPDLLKALEEERITLEQLKTMSYDDLEEALSENIYPQDKYRMAYN